MTCKIVQTPTEEQLRLPKKLQNWLAEQEDWYSRSAKKDLEPMWQGVQETSRRYAKNH